MDFYPKKLDGLAALRKEKEKLKAEADEMEAEGFFSLSNLTGSAAQQAEDKSGGEESDSPNGLLAMLLPMAGPVFSNISSFLPTMGGGLASMVKGRAKNILFSVGKEVIGGYLKWKAVELSVKGVRYLVKKAKEKRQENKPI